MNECVNALDPPWINALDEEYKFIWYPDVTTKEGFVSPDMAMDASKRRFLVLPLK